MTAIAPKAPELISPGNQATSKDRKGMETSKGIGAGITRVRLSGSLRPDEIASSMASILTGQRSLRRPDGAIPFHCLHSTDVADSHGSEGLAQPRACTRRVNALASSAAL